MRRSWLVACSGVAAVGGWLGGEANRALAGPNLVVNGDLNWPQQMAEAHPKPLGDGLYWEFDGDLHFGRVVVSGTNNARPYHSDVHVGYAELGRAATGGLRGLLIDTKDLKPPSEPGTLSVWFDLRGKIRPGRTYEYSFVGIVLGRESDQGETFKVIAPAMWADGKPLGAEFEVEFDGVPSARSGKIKMPEFTRQTGMASLVFEIPESFREQFLLRRVVFREIDQELLAGGKPEMPVPIRYIPAQSEIEERIAEAIRECTQTLKRTLENAGLRQPGRPGGDDATIQGVAIMTAALAELGISKTREKTRGVLNEAESEEATTRRLLKDALNYLANTRRLPENEPKRTEAVAWRLYCLSRHGDPQQHGQTMARDIEWLRHAQRDDGGWAEISAEEDNQAAKRVHSTNAISAQVIEALREAHYASKPIQSGVWRKAAKYWVQAQGRDGGFRGVMQQYGGIGELPTVMRTATGLSSLLATLDIAFSAGGRSCTQFRANKQQIEAIGKSWDWLTANYTVGFEGMSEITASLDDLVAGGADPFLQTFYLFRATAVTGRNMLGAHNLFQAEAQNLLRQYPRGSGLFGGNAVNTALGLLPMTSANAPTVLQRIVVGGDEASLYKRDAEHLMRYLARKRNRTFNWRETSIDRSMLELVKVPILYLSIEAAPDWSDSQWAKLRTYCFEGGVILVNIAAECDAREVIEQEFAELFPEYQWSDLAPDDKFWETNKKLEMADPPKVIGNGFKHFVFLTPRDWSCILQLLQYAKHPEPFQFVDCLLTYTTDGNPLPGSLEKSQYEPGAIGDRTLRMLHMQTGGHEVPVYPDLVKTMNRLMRAHYRVNVVEAKADATGDAGPALVWVTHAGDQELSDKEREVIRKHMRRGAYVFVEVASGNESWAKSFRDGVSGIDPGLRMLRMPAMHPVYTGDVRGTLGFDRRQVRYRKALRSEKIESGRCPMHKLLLDDEEAGVFCGQDICSGVSYTQIPEARGPMPKHARELAMNVVLQAIERQAR